MACIFCKIIAKTAGSKVFFEDDDIIVFADILPRAKVHLLIAPKDHYERLVDLPEKFDTIVLKRARRIAEQLGVGNNFRLQLNNGAQSGQIVGHLHFHFMSNQNGVEIEYTEYK
ncbi:MAG: HIT domain-containing protein [Candidatus Zixiibacteriota bacterium]